MLCLKIKKKKLRTIELEQELEWNKNMNNWLKVLIKCKLKKKEILLVEHLIGTEKDKRYI